MEAPVYNIGDVVRVRDWDDMVANYGLSYGDIRHNGCTFGLGEAWQCGKIFRIAKIDYDDGHVNYYPSCDEKDLLTSSGEPWLFRDWMLEPIAEWRSPDVQAILELLEEVA